MTGHRLTFYCILLFSLTCIFPARAQQTAVATDTVRIPSVMLVPYDPLYYLSDADHDIAEQSKYNMQKVRKTFHTESDYYTYRAIARHFRCIDLLHDTSAASREDLITIFSTVGYKYEDPMPVKTGSEKLKTETGKKDATANPVTASKYRLPEPNLQYMNAVPGKPELLKALGKKYEVDYFVFLNQFEIKTNYNSCIDLANKIYQRTILLHFSIYDASGKQVAGNFVYSFFPSNSSESEEIIRTCFAELGEGISKNLTGILLTGTVNR